MFLSSYYYLSENLSSVTTHATGCINRLMSNNYTSAMARNLELLPSYLRKQQHEYSALLDDFVDHTKKDMHNMQNNMLAWLSWRDFAQTALRLAPPGSTLAEVQAFVLQKLPNRMGLDPLESLALGPDHPDPKKPWRSAAIIALDVCEVNDHYEVTAHLPGVTKEEVKLDAEEQLLKIKVEKSDAPATTKEEEQSTAADDERSSLAAPRYLRVELPSTYAPRNIRMPEGADLEQVEAKMLADGVLLITIAKKASAIKKKTRSIAIGS